VTEKTSTTLVDGNGAVTLDPWKPPSGWDREDPPAKEEGPWTVRRVLSAMGRAFRKQPFAVLLAVE
jgi:hypothetical protein